LKTRSKTGVAALVAGCSALAALLLGPLFAYAGVLNPVVGFQLFLLGILAGLVALVLGGIGIQRAHRRGAGKLEAHAGLVAGILAAALLVTVFVTRGFQRAHYNLNLVDLAYHAAYHPVRFTLEQIRFYSPVNDVTTNPKEPLDFVAARAARNGSEAEWAYSEEDALLQERVYPGLRNLYITFNANEAYQKGLEIAHELGWEVHTERPDIHEFEAYASSPIFRFVDDVVVRFHEGPYCVFSAHAPCWSTAVDLRSRSRVGESDLGANADRVCTFLEKIWLATGYPIEEARIDCRQVGVFAATP